MMDIIRSFQIFLK